MMIPKIIKSTYFHFAIIALLIFVSSIMLPNYIATNRDNQFLDQIKDDSVNIYDREYPDSTPAASPVPTLESFSTMIDAYHYAKDWSVATNISNNETVKNECLTTAKAIISKLHTAGLLPQMDNTVYETLEFEYRLMRMAPKKLDFGFWIITMFSDDWVVEIAIEEDYQRIASLTIAKGNIKEELNFREYDYKLLLNSLSDYMNIYNDFSFKQQSISVDQYPFVIYRIDMDSEIFFLTIRQTEAEYFFDFQSYYEYMPAS